MLKEYKTILGYGECEEIINKSRFIGYSKPIETEDEAIEFIEGIKKKHWDATHNVPVYVLGDNYEIQRYSDDGEPSGTAGLPILDMIKREGIKNVVVVVTRYFGGIKLGTGGLVRAYTNTAKTALSKSRIVNKVLYNEFTVIIDYTLHGKVQNEILNIDDLKIKDTIYEDKVKMHVYCKLDWRDKFSGLITEISNGKAKIIEGNLVYLTLLDGKIIDT